MAIYFIQINAIVILILCAVYSVSRNGKILPMRNRAFNTIIYMTFGICVSDIFAGICQEKTFAGAREITHIANMVYYLTTTWTCYSWLGYVNIRLKLKEEEMKKWEIYSSIPLIIMAAVIISNPFTKLLFSLDENNVYSRGNGVFIHWIITYGYMITSFIQIILSVRTAKTKNDKKERAELLWFPIIPAIAGAIQVFIYGVSAIQCGIALGMIMISAKALQGQIMSDPLTGLNNRRALQDYIAQRLDKVKARFCVYMCDVDDFKKINDNYGHNMGDTALKRVAGVLKKTCSSSSGNLFLCRYGGDEFIVCHIGNDDVTDVYDILLRKMESENDSVSDGIQLGISVGYSEGLCATEDEAQNLIDLADQRMYEFKKRKGVGRS